jgi:gamma-glutamylcyclotransferase (GGCT)/AIG2-like uncharacterized protein YtfP
VTDRLFAYGTLLPGQPRWRFLEPLVRDDGSPCAVPGELFDTGLGYPAAVFAAGEVPSPSTTLVRGRVFRFRDDIVERALAEIDEVERVADEAYQRVQIDTDGHGPVWAYEYVAPHRFVHIAGGSWVEHAAG